MGVLVKAGVALGTVGVGWWVALAVGVVVLVGVRINVKVGSRVAVAGGAVGESMICRAVGLGVVVGRTALPLPT